tara:strand:+ start:530 stop:1318 length:789 start_codon:yes stop_codon:yes gene_type:complete
MLKISWILIIIVTAIIFNRLILNNKISKIPSYLFVVVFTILSLLFLDTINFWILLISSLGIILAFGEMIALNQMHSTQGQILKSNIFIGAIGLLDYNLYVFALINLMALIVHKELNWRNTVITLLCLAWPFLLFFSVTKLYPNWDINSPSNNLLSTVEINISKHYISLFILAIILIPAISELYKNFHKKTETAKKAYLVLLLISSIIITLTIITQSLSFIYFLTIPLTLIITNYLLYTKHRYFRTFLLGLLLISILLEFFYL